MKTGKTLVELATELERQQNSKRDFVADTRELTVIENHGDDVGVTTPHYALGVNGHGAFNLTPHTHTQIAQRLGIPQKYYDRVAAEAPELLRHNVEHWFRTKPERRMIRTLDGNTRAFLSDRYRPLDNADLAEAMLPVLSQLDVEIMSCEVTERRLYIKAIDRRVMRDIPTGRKLGDGSHIFFDTLSPAIVISNSEIGAGALSIEAGVYTKVCTNMAIIGERSLKKYHVGARADFAEEVYALFSDKTRRVTDAAVWAQVRDIVKGAFDQARFDASVQKIAGLVEQKIEADPVTLLEAIAQPLGMTEGERSSVLKHLIAGGELSRYGLFNAITRTAEDLPDYDRATDFERMGGNVIELPRNDWAKLANAA